MKISSQAALASLLAGSTGFIRALSDIAVAAPTSAAHWSSKIVQVDIIMRQLRDALGRTRN
ncbi:hypothetical protein HZZ13_33440 [Bradyrhizobium sp. CNPSo 4010]|uniref:Uncharacterized protein n=1 Tax=Bradyrhizobium agreste TaxID=2751811 RepID=A0ABS0Q0M5_9BRAD|nr:hypothetical protein [Bradyrhizobium agreste]MBH5402662.1 hypothetical protein [Bradyrhizobium agreste]